MIANLFAGTWNLASVRFYKPNGKVVLMYGATPQGMLTYDAQGHMNGQVMQQERPALPKGRGVPGALEDYHAILRGYIAYFGTYQIDETSHTITHHVLGSLIPDWVGTEQVRLYEFSKDAQQLTLRTSPSRLQGDTMAGELIWVRGDVTMSRENGVTSSTVP